MYAATSAGRIAEIAIPPLTPRDDLTLEPSPARSRDEVANFQAISCRSCCLSKGTPPRNTFTEALSVFPGIAATGVARSTWYRNAPVRFPHGFRALTKRARRQKEGTTHYSNIPAKLTEHQQQGYTTTAPVHSKKHFSWQILRTCQRPDTQSGIYLSP